MPRECPFSGAKEVVMKKVLFENERCSVFFVIRDDYGEFEKEDEESLDDFFALRHQEFAENEEFEPKTKSRKEKDRYDDWRLTDYLLVYSRRKLIAGCRFIDGRKIRLPIENLARDGSIRLTKKIGSNSFEISRLTIDRRYSRRAESSFFLNLILIWAINIYGQQYGFDCAYAVMRGKYLASLKQKQALKDGLHFRSILSKLEEVIGDSFEYKRGEIFTPIRFCASRARRILGDGVDTGVIEKACQKLSLAA